MFQNFHPRASKKAVEALLNKTATLNEDNLNLLLEDWLEMFDRINDNTCESCGEVQENAPLIKLCRDC